MRRASQSLTGERKPKADRNDLVLIEHVRRLASAHESGLSSDIVTITPGMAYEWLERGGENRPLNQSRIQRYAAAMVAGDWRLTGESIKLDCQGHVRDGQHRLWACIESEVSFITMVTINVPNEAFDVMDSGAARSNADVLALHHVPNAKLAAGCARYSIIWDETGTPNGGLTPSKLHILRWIEKNPDAGEWVNITRRMTRSGVPGGESIWSAVLYRLSRVDEQDARAMAESLTTGANLEPGDPLLALRNRLTQSAARNQKVDANELAALAVKSWNFYRQGRKISLLKWVRGGVAREDFPTAI